MENDLQKYLWEGDMLLPQAGSSPNGFLRLHCPSHPQNRPGTWAPHATTVISRRLFTCTLRPGRMVQRPSPDSEDPTARRWFCFTFRKTAIDVICPYVPSILEYRAGLCGNVGNITCAVDVYHDFFALKGSTYTLYSRYYIQNLVV